ncbi:MAG TPA: MFS transporter [Stellaceae bacterium]|nr:MFS transporter [Stellaceae bacterium]
MHRLNDAATPTRKITAWTLAAAIAGNALEWYDFTIYGYMAVTIAKLFFPTGAAWSSLLSALAVFGVAYGVRPLGGIVLGNFADLYGRKSVLVAVIGLMTCGTAILVVTPSYAAIGVAAPLLIVLARVLQGLSAGGEFGTAATFLVEHAPPSQRGYFGAWQFAGQGAAVLLSGLIGGLLVRTLTLAEIDAWGWRLPFAIGLLIGPVGVLMRLRLDETPDFRRGRSPEGDSPIAEVFRAHKAALGIGFALVVGGTAIFYVLLVFMPTYAVQVLHLPAEVAFVAPAISGLVMMVFCPLMGWCSDILGRRRIMAVTAAAGIILLYPAFAWLEAQPSVARVASVAVFFGLLFSGYAGPFSAALAELFPTGTRSTAMSIAYNLGVSLFGGFSPLMVAWLIAVTGERLAPCYYVMVCLAISLAALAAMPGARETSLRH